MKKLNVNVRWECIDRSRDLIVDVPDEVYGILNKREGGEPYKKAFYQLIEILDDYVTDVIILENGITIKYMWYIMSLGF